MAGADEQKRSREVEKSTGCNVGFRRFRFPLVTHHGGYHSQWILTNLTPLLFLVLSLFLFLVFVGTPRQVDLTVNPGVLQRLGHSFALEAAYVDPLVRLKHR
jgi:hypothetical protein